MLPRILILGALLRGALLPAETAPPADDAFQFFQAEDQVVTATKFQTSLKETPATVTIISAEEIARHGYRTLAEALEGVTGLYQNTDRSYTYLGVRGLDVLGDWSSRVLVLVDGITMNDPLYGSGYIGRELGLDIGAVKRIEVVMGPGSAVYGGHALFAVVNVITKQASDAPGASVAATYASGNGRQLQASAGGSLGGVQAYAQWSGLLSDGGDVYAKDYGLTAHGADYEQATSALLKLSAGGFSLNAGLSARNKGIANADGYSIFGDTRSNQVDKGDWIEAKLTGGDASSGTTWTLRAYHRDYGYEGHYYVLYPGAPPYQEENISLGDSKTLGGEAQLNLQPFEHDTLTLGLSQEHHYRLFLEDYDYGLTSPSLYYVYNYDLRALVVSAGYFQDIYKPVEGLSLIAGGRLDVYSSYGQSFSPRLGLLYSFWGGNTVKLLYGKAFNPPNSYQMNYSDGGLTALANPDLKPENMESYEAVYERELGPARLSLDAYQNRVTGLISTVDVGGGVTQYQNVGDVISDGAELKLKGEWGRWSGRAGAALQRSYDQSSGSIIWPELSNSPELTANAGLSAPLGGGASLSVDEVYMGARKLVGGAWMSPYNRCDLTLYAPGWVPHAGLTLKVRDLFDEDYADPGTGGTQLEYPADRRNYSATLSLAF